MSGYRENRQKKGENTRVTLITTTNERLFRYTKGKAATIIKRRVTQKAASREKEGGKSVKTSSAIATVERKDGVRGKRLRT